MFRPRVIPVLLLRNLGLVKTVKFDKHRYIGDPINAVKIFNDLKADELAFVDIMASRKGHTVPLDFVKKVGDEANMPFAVGGGIRTNDDIREIIKAGAEKVIINTEAVKRPDFIKESSSEFGSSTIVVSIDVRSNWRGKKHVYINDGTKKTKLDPLEHALRMQDLGAGEVVLNSIDRDGTMSGYDQELVHTIADRLTIPLIACGGAGSFNDVSAVVQDAHASAAAAGSIFVYHGPRNAVLINYPTSEELDSLISK